MLKIGELKAVLAELPDEMEIRSYEDSTVEISGYMFAQSQGRGWTTHLGVDREHDGKPADILLLISEDEIENIEQYEEDEKYFGFTGDTPADYNLHSCRHCAGNGEP